MPKVRIGSNGGIVGEDRTDWLPGSTHEASDGYARELVRRGVAVIVGGEAVSEPAKGLTTDAITPVANRMSHAPKRR